MSIPVVSTQENNPLIEFTGELHVNALAVSNFMAEINLLPWVTPATRIPIIRITMDNSINEKAFLLLSII